jgi:hypothetical protein
MRNPHHQPDNQQSEVIASFGDANLIRKPDLQYALVGGTAADRAEAEEWISMFMKYHPVQGSAHRPQPKP